MASSADIPVSLEARNIGGDEQAVIDTALAAAEPKRLAEEDVYSIVVPTGAEHKVIDTERFGRRPDQVRGAYRPATVDSLIDYVKPFDDDGCAVWVHPTSGAIEAVLNDNAGEPGWGDHRAVLMLINTPEWDHWISRDGQLLSQQEFAEHVEGGVKEIIEPPAADMLELAQSFHAATSIAFRSAHRISSGQVQVQYEEEIDAKAGQGGREIEIPQEFELSLAPFVGEDPYKVIARLRYRVSAGTLKLGYKLDHPDRVKQDALEKIADRFREHFTVYLGTPASARR